MSEPNYIRTISTEFNSPNTDILLYSIPENRRFVSFCKECMNKNEINVNIKWYYDEYHWIWVWRKVTVSGAESQNNNGYPIYVNGTYTWKGNGLYINDDGNGMMLVYYDGGWCIGESDQQISEIGGYYTKVGYEPKGLYSAVAGTMSEGASSCHVSGGALWRLKWRRKSYTWNFSIPTEGYVDFKESSDNGTTKKTYARVGYERHQNVKEFFDGGTNIYVNANVNIVQQMSNIYVGNLSATYTPSTGSNGTYTFNIINSNVTGSERAWKSNTTEGGDYIIYNNSRWEMYHNAGASVSTRDDIISNIGTMSLVGYNSTIDGNWTNGNISITIPVAGYSECIASMTGILFDEHMHPIPVEEEEE